MSAAIRSYSACAAVALTVSASVLILWPAGARGDGGYMPPYGQDVWEPEQKALILFDEETGIEDLIIQAAFHGDAREFAWIVPVPSLPELDVVDPQIFYDCSDLTQPRPNRSRGVGCWRDDEGRGSAINAPDTEVDIYDDRLVGIYRALTLGSNDATALTDSLSAWGYLHEDNREGIEAALRFYIDKSWYFVAMKVDMSDAEGATDPRDVWYGRLQPIRLTFSAPEIVYPMRISAISADDQSEVLLYVCARHRMLLEGARTEYARRISHEELERIESRHRVLGQLLETPCFMTKLRRTFTPEEMNEDLTFRRAPVDFGYVQIDWTSLPLGEGIILAVLWLALARPWRRRSTRP